MYSWWIRVPSLCIRFPEDQGPRNPLLGIRSFREGGVVRAMCHGLEKISINNFTGAMHIERGRGGGRKPNRGSCRSEIGSSRDMC